MKLEICTESWWENRGTYGVSFTLWQISKWLSTACNLTMHWIFNMRYVFTTLRLPTILQFTELHGQMVIEKMK